MAMQSQNLGANPGAMAMGGFGDVFNIVSAVGEYRNSQEQGDNAAISLAKGVTNFAWGEFYYGGVGRFMSNAYNSRINPIKIPFNLISAGGNKLSAFSNRGINSGSKILNKVGKIGSITGKTLQDAGMVGNFAANMGLTILVSSAPMIASQIPKMWEHTADVMTKSYRQRGKLGSGYFEMSQAGYTMRQRSLNAIRQNGLNTQSVLGNEARTYFRSSGLDY